MDNLSMEFNILHASKEIVWFSRPINRCLRLVFASMCLGISKSLNVIQINKMTNCLLEFYANFNDSTLFLVLMKLYFLI
jgi:hypothetical protein